jgi:hypothetical protein
MPAFVASKFVVILPYRLPHRAKAIRPAMRLLANGNEGWVTLDGSGLLDRS